MDYKQLIKKIKQDTWWSEESPANYQLVICAWRAFVMQNHVYKKKFLSTCIALYKNDFGYEKTSEQEKLSEFNYVRNLYLKNPKKVKKFYQDFLKVTDNMIRICEPIVKKLRHYSNEELADAYTIIQNQALIHFMHSVMPESADIYTEEHLIKDIQRDLKILDFQSASELAFILSTGAFLSFMEKERLEFLKLTLSKNPNFQKFSQKYYWLQSNYLSSRFLDAKYFEKESNKLKKEKTNSEIQSELDSLLNKVKLHNQKIKNLLKQNKFSYKLKKTLELLRFMSLWIDTRKMGAVRKTSYLDMTVREIVRRTKMPINQINYYTPEETVNLLKNKQKVPLNTLIQRRKLSVYVACPTTNSFTEQIYTGKNAQKIFKLFETTNSKELKGFVASVRGVKLKGIAQVINNPHTEKFIKGRILIATMTRPDFVPIMRYAKAIITDEGGITSHAAIVSRELKIPCIIGTKIASKSIKSGQKIEIDTTNGRITIL